jgi:hypothetical protein
MYVSVQYEPVACADRDSGHSNLVASLGKTKEETADAALKRAFDRFSIEYIPRPRPRDNTSPPSADTGKLMKSLGASFTRAVTPAAAGGGIMPCLTRRGFAKITAIELLRDPARHWGNFAHVIKMYDLDAVRAWGDLPRGVLPEEADPRMLAHVARLQAVANEPGKLRSAAVYAKNKLDKLEPPNFNVNQKDAIFALELITGLPISVFHQPNRKTSGTNLQCTPHFEQAKF